MILGKAVTDIFSIKGLYAKIHVKEPSSVVFGSNLYTGISTYILIGKRKSEESIKDSFVLTFSNQGTLSKSLSILSDALMKGKIFSVDKTGKHSISKKSLESFTFEIRSNNGDLLKMVPSIMEEDDITYEGVSICFGDDVNVIQLTANEFHNFEYAISKIDLFIYSNIVYGLALLKGHNITSEKEARINPFERKGKK